MDDRDGSDDSRADSEEEAEESVAGSEAREGRGRVEKEEREEVDGKYEAPSSQSSSVSSASSISPFGISAADDEADGAGRPWKERAGGEEEKDEEDKEVVEEEDGGGYISVDNGGGSVTWRIESWHGKWNSRLHTSTQWTNSVHCNGCHSNMRRPKDAQIICSHYVVAVNASNNQMTGC